jgi:hypothetical protein
MRYRTLCYLVYTLRRSLSETLVSDKKFIKRLKQIAYLDLRIKTIESSLHRHYIGTYGNYHYGSN